VDMMVEIGNDGVRGLFEETETMANPKVYLWTILDTTKTHFLREDAEAFPMGEALLLP
jgi:hypothetical protein